MKEMKMAWVPYVPLDRYCCVIYVEQYLLPFVFIAYIPAFSYYIETYYFVHLDIALPTGSAGLKAWKQKYSLSVAPSGREFYELMLSKFHALGYIFISVAYLFQSIFIHHLVMCHICTTTSSDYLIPGLYIYRSALMHTGTERVDNFCYSMPCKLNWV